MWESIVLWAMGKKSIKVSTSKPVIIYAIRPLNRKSILYCGQTKQDIEARIYTHITEAMSGKHKNKKLQDAMKKYKFLVTYDILEVTSEDKADIREKFWIDKFLREKNPLCNIRNPMNRFSNLKGK